MTTEPSRTDSIRARVLSGIAWKAGSQVTLQLTRMAVALVLARLLTPHDWGVAAMVIAFAGFAVVFTDNALGTALIQRRRLLDEDKSTVFWVSAALGVGLAVVGVAAAGPIADFYGEPEVRWLFVVFSTGFVVSALGTTQMALLVREMQFRRLELRQIAATVVGAVTGITIALLGYGAWAIVGQLLAEAVVSTVLLWVLTPWRPSLVFSTASLRRLGGFAGSVFAQNMVWQATRSLSAIVIGRVLGAAALGVYTLGMTVILLPFARIAAPLQQVFFPAFAQLRDERERMADIWIRATRMVAAVSIPSLVGIAIVADDFVQVVLGPKWSDAAILIQILAVVGIFQSLHTLTAEVLLALGRAGTFLAYTLLWAGAILAAVALGVQGGITRVAACYAVATVLVEPVHAYLTTRALGIPLGRYVRSLSGVVQSTLLMAAAVLAARKGFAAVGVPASASLVLLVLIGGIVYVAASLWRAPEVTREIGGVLARRRRFVGGAEAKPETGRV
jgi:O-antigen/teichoic acid export membrane protein